MKTEPNEGFAYMPWKNIYKMWEIRLYFNAIETMKAVSPNYYSMCYISKRFFNHIQRRAFNNYFRYEPDTGKPKLIKYKGVTNG